MRKILLLGAAVLFSVAASAQLTSKASDQKATAQHKAMPQATFKKQVAVPAKEVGQPVFSGLTRQKRFNMTESMKKSMKKSDIVSRYSAPRRAGTVQALYYATGVDYSTKTPVQWEMQSDVAQDETPVLVDLIPDSIWGKGGVALPYTLNENTVTVNPILVASSESYNLYFADANSDDGSLSLTLGEDGSLTYSGSNLTLGYMAFSGDFDPNYGDTYLGFYELVQNIDYRLPGAAPKTPNVSFAQDNLILFAGLGPSGYSYNSNLAIMGGYAPVAFKNQTTDVATAWSWNITEETEEGENVLKANTVDYTLNTIGDAVYSNICLVGENSGSVADTVKFGCGHPDKDGVPQYTEFYAYAGQTGDTFEFTDGTMATLSAMNPDADLTFYTNWATPDKASNSMSKIYCYHDKPSSPLYIEGFNLPMVSFEQVSKFELTLKIYACERTAKDRVTVGELIAQSKANSRSINAEYASQSGLTIINFDQLSVVDDMGMSESIDYLFLDDDFIVCIEGWDNGTFKGVLGCEAQPYEGKNQNTWFEKTGEEGSMYRYTTWPTTLWVGINGAAMGFLHTTDNTNLAFEAEGGTATIHIDPMLHSIDSETEEPTYRLFIETVEENGEEVEEVPEWITIGVANEDYSAGDEYDLVVEVTAMPEGVTARNASIKFMQEGALLTVKVAQGEDAGVEGVKATVSKNGKTYDLSGRLTKKGKGLVVRDGKMFMQR